MNAPSTLRLLASTNNARGDLFTRLVKDLFFALGYDDLRLDVHKSGREIDIQGTHRREPKRLVAECKAHADKMGGDELNKFFGVLTRERNKAEPTPVVGYFVSLNGFRETGKEQELETSEQQRLILIDGKCAIEELVRCKILVDHTHAVEVAGHCAERAGLATGVLEGAELLGHEIGYVWAIYYAQGKQRTHFALIHADGTPLAESVAKGVINADRECEGTLHSLVYLAPPQPLPDRTALAKASVERYCRWISEECGFIQLDGLPADTDLSAVRMKLEKLFVPLKLASLPRQATDEDDQREMKEKEWVGPVGEFLGTHPRFSLLAKPGGGKSTLLKRLAIAYADPKRRTEADDRLPDCDWLPLFLRCRELRDRAHRPIRELLDDLPAHAAMNNDERLAFREQIDDALRSGQAMLLIDGLDEISDEGARKVFAQHLRTFLAMFPQVALIVTSREAGFRHVAGVIASACEQATLAPFDKNDVLRLCESWNVEVVGDNEKVRTEARQLAETIWNNERIRALATNPLMLTTLLVVKRWLRELPRKRVELYRDAIRVLIRAWNVEGYDPLDEEETLTQLSYVACAMMNEGVQQIGHKRLLNLLKQARSELQSELQFASVSPEKFVERIEYRSSLLMQTGHEQIDDELQPVYEFRHLTFQEYLAARGLVEEQYPGRDDGKTLAELLASHLEDERWREVIPLAAVLAGRKAEDLIRQLTEACESLEWKYESRLREDIGGQRVVLLWQCLLDEVQVTPLALQDALRTIARFGNDHMTSQLRRGKFGQLFQALTEQAYFEMGDRWDQFAGTMNCLAFENVFQGATTEFSGELAVTLEGWLNSGNRMTQTRAACVCSRLAFINQEASLDKRASLAKLFHPLRDALGRLLSGNDPPLALAAAWALAWTGRARFPPAPTDRGVILSLYRLCLEAKSTELAHFAAWALSDQPLLPRDTFGSDEWGDRDIQFENQSAGEVWKMCLLVLAWYRRTPWRDSELAEKINTLRDHERSRTFEEILATLGSTGQAVLDKWKKEKHKLTRFERHAIVDAEAPN